MSSSIEWTMKTSFHPPPVFGLSTAGRPVYETRCSQSSGNCRLRSDCTWSMSGMYCLFGRTTVFGTATPSFRASVHSKNFSSACHQNGSLMTVVPRRTALLRCAAQHGELGRDPIVPALLVHDLDEWPRERVLAPDQQSDDLFLGHLPFLSCAV